MANVQVTPADGEHDQNVVYYKWRFTVGATGALTAVNVKGLKGGITGSTRNSAGSYTWKIEGTTPGGVLAYAGTIIGAYTTDGGTVAVMTVDNTKAGTAPSITVVFYAVGTQTATEVDEGVDIVFAFAVKNGLV